MATVKEIYQSIDAWAPFATQMDFDNSGFLVGRGSAVVDKILVALDITRTVIEEAEQLGAQLIVSHHPVIFRPSRHGMPHPFNPRLATPAVPVPGISICARRPKRNTFSSRRKMPPSVEISVH